MKIAVKTCSDCCNKLNVPHYYQQNWVELVSLSQKSTCMETINYGSKGQF